ncbi:uncharacterized protein LOC126630222 [Malus sylvestris]|uniref:uncharacterized protein LOC126630222 n=1 Tax=Malus sylvestris TaxID=3752 RepID=UPI0021AC10BF|nr:uncharacterized protein LOC126630222 [Malus sylvestris]
MLKPDDRRRITQFWSIDSSDEYWTAETTDFNYYRIMVLKDDLHSLIANGPTSTQIVDSFCYMKREKENITKQKNFYVSTTIFHNINEQSIETTLQNKERLYNQLMDQYGIVSKIFFPLFHYNHFSLVVLDTKNAEMIHYNSLRQSTTDEDLDFDCYWENAEIVGHFVQYWLDKAKKSTSNSNAMDSTQATTKKINSIKSDFEFQVKEDRTCAQQKPTSYVIKLKAF